jgi:hypothetical protein
MHNDKKDAALEQHREEIGTASPVADRMPSGHSAVRHGVAARLSRPNNNDQVIWLTFLLRVGLHESGNHSTLSPVWPARRSSPPRREPAGDLSRLLPLTGPLLHIEAARLPPPQSLLS